MTEKTLTTYPYRSEILFLYDIFRCNPNGDPFENRPRQDPVTGKIDITDVRLKRTIRDYIIRYKHQPDKDNNLKVFVWVVGEKALTAERRYEEIFKELPKATKIKEAKERLVNQCVDVRLFGTLLPITEKEKSKGKKSKEETTEAVVGEEKGAGIQITGAVQFNPGQSLHAVEVVEISGTGGFASKEKARQKTFRREYLVPYALIGFYGVINENLAKESELTENDVNLLMEAIWNGTLSLHSRSKAFHHPRLLVRLDYKDQRQCGYFLDRLKLLPKKDEKEIRSPSDYQVDFESWLNEVSKQKNYLERIYCRLDSGLQILPIVRGANSLDLQSGLKELVENNNQKLTFA
jgi:CRISPR-associated protein Csh2